MIEVSKFEFGSIRWKCDLDSIRIRLVHPKLIDSFHPIPSARIFSSALDRALEFFSSQPQIEDWLDEGNWN